MIQFGINFARASMQWLETILDTWSAIVEQWQDIDTNWENLD
jgi:hypothetical protein|tara:strand:+ start:737 stop:862 length:126 start_codon:yes stop_codon:yes gene_type:complete